MRTITINTIKDPFDWRLRIGWLDAVNLVVGWILILDDTLLFTCTGALLFAVTLGQVWFKWRLRRDHPLLLVF